MNYFVTYFSGFARKVFHFQKNFKVDEISTNTKTFVQRYIEEEIASSEFSGQGQKKICLTTSSKIKSFVHSGIFFRKIYFTSQFSLFLYISFDINMAPILTNMWMYGKSPK